MRSMSAVRRCTWPIVTPGSIGRGARCIGTIVPWSWLWSDALAIGGAYAGRRRRSAPGGVALHAARVRAGAQHAVAVAAHRAQATDRPGLVAEHVVAAAAQAVDRLGAGGLLDGQPARLGAARVEGAGEVRRRERGCLDRLLQVEPEVGVREQELQRPLVLPVAAGRAPREVRLSVAQGERRGERRPRALAGRERVRQ